MDTLTPYGVMNPFTDRPCALNTPLTFNCSFNDGGCDGDVVGVGLGDVYYPSVQGDSNTPLGGPSTTTALLFGSGTATKSLLMRHVCDGTVVGGWYYSSVCWGKEAAIGGGHWNYRRCSGGIC